MTGRCPCLLIRRHHHSKHNQCASTHFRTAILPIAVRVDVALLDPGGMVFVLAHTHVVRQLLQQ